MQQRRHTTGRLPPPLWAGQSHVEILDSNRACESAAGFQSCAHDPISIPMLRPFAENWPHAIALPASGGGNRVAPSLLLTAVIPPHRDVPRQKQTLHLIGEPEKQHPDHREHQNGGELL